MKWTYRNQINNFLTAVSNNSEGEIWVYGDITSDKWSDEDVTPTSIRDALENMGPVGTLNIRVNSYGGSVYAGNSIINIIDSYKRKHNVKVNAYIEGIAASMGSGIPMVADKIYMAENAMMMIHKPYTIVMGNSADLEKEITILQKVEDALVKNYMRHFNGTEEQLRDMLADETWLTADEALEYGFCHEIVEAVEIAASAKGLVINGREFKHDADKIAAKFNPGTPLAKAEPSQNQNAKKDGKSMFEYDDKLKEYGIDEEKFKSFNLSSDVVLNILDSAMAMKFMPDPPYRTEDAVVLPAKEIKSCMGLNDDSALPPDQLLYTLIHSGTEYNPDDSTKAKAYDKLVNSAIDEAIKNGVRAKGESFNDTKWKKILNGLDYDEILDQSREWDEEAKRVLNAGKRMSEPWKPDGPADNKLVNPEDYSLFK